MEIVLVMVTKRMLFIKCLSIIHQNFYCKYELTEILSSDWRFRQFNVMLELIYLDRIFDVR